MSTETSSVETEQAAREASGAHPYGRYLEEFEVGAVYKHWPAKTVTEADDHMFCLITMNHHPLHINDVYATGETSLLGAPRVVQKLLYPLAYFDLVAPAARQYGVNPLLLLGMMKQESAFEPRAQSSANARGLTQFIPDTARAVAAELQWPNWTWEDMNRPYVSVPFGAHYLSGLIRTFRGNYHFALAGYNGGPGNVLRWAKGDWSRDLDLFVEEIGFVETRTYVKIVSGNFELYKAIYYR